ncbi:MAG: cytochrome c biogenesis protein CcsA, partial [Bacteroidetes bacterium]|nr:cytochrome c biogenesis protein CcsA [Bacteroidota bacterium]
TGIVFGVLFHTAGLILRWYISGYAPWTNGYESLIYIAWAISLAGILIAWNSIGGMAATIAITSIILWIAKLSYLDPEITPLIPVLNSKWLILHVSIVAGSYGFLLLGAILGFINLLLMLMLKEYNKKRLLAIITELSYLGERALMVGIALLSVGTFLGGVWANESWGRYWGWDAKETWALISILVYAFILQLHLIPKLSGLFAYNVAALFGLSSVIMTYCGVNYYLSGLHSFAAGNPMPVPAWVYIILAGLIMTSIGAYQRKKKLNI